MFGTVGAEGGGRSGANAFSRLRTLVHWSQWRTPLDADLIEDQRLGPLRVVQMDTRAWDQVFQNHTACDAAREVRSGPWRPVLNSSPPEVGDSAPKPHEYQRCITDSWHGYCQCIMQLHWWSCTEEIWLHSSVL